MRLCRTFGYVDLSLMARCLVVAAVLMASCSVKAAVELELRQGTVPLPLPAVFQQGKGMQLALYPVNLLPNPSFEAVEGDNPVHWTWNQRTADSTFTVDTTVAHSGRNSVYLTNNTPYGPERYSCLALTTKLPVKPETVYTVSYFVRGQHISRGFFGTWGCRCRLPRTTGGQWVKVEKTFVTGPGQDSIPVLLTTESPTDGFWVDDVSIIETYQPWNQHQYPSDEYIFANGQLVVRALLWAPRNIHTVTISASVTGGEGLELHEEVHRPGLSPGLHTLQISWPIEAQHGGQVRIQLQVQGTDIMTGQLVNAQTAADRQLITRADVEAELKQAESARQQLEERVNSLQEKGVESAYLRSTLTILRNFVGLIRSNLRRGETALCYDAARQLHLIAQQALGRDFLPPVPRFVPPEQGRPYRITGCSLRGTVRWPNGNTELNRPLQFVGYGHFSPVIRDMEKWPDYGHNVIQRSISPRVVLPSEDEVDLTQVNKTMQMLDRAHKVGVGVDLLLSPHIFPQWALEKWPVLQDCHGHFCHYCIHAPQARQVLEKYLRIVIPYIADHPALHSLCLSNEPAGRAVKNCHFLPDLWHQWLQEKHGTIDQLNQRWGSEYASFEEVPIPEPVFRGKPIVYDFIHFHQQVEAGFHKWMADIIREMAPDVPLHAKLMMGNQFNKGLDGPWSISPQLFAQFCDYNGNDCSKYWGGSDWANEWLTENMAYDFQRSIAHKPICNTENHLIPDYYPGFVPPEHIANVLWQGAIHGQSSTAIWKWGFSCIPGEEYYGLIMNRPACTQAAAYTALDLMRLAPQVAAFQRMRPPVVLMWSLASMVGGSQHIWTLRQMYEGLNFCGVPLGFATERQLEQYAQTGQLPVALDSAKVVIIPWVTHVSDRVLSGLQRFIDGGGKVVMVGQCFGQDEYGQPRKKVHLPAEHFELPETAQEVFKWAESRLSNWGVVRRVTLHTTDGEPAWGVEYLATRQNGQWLVNLSNYRKQAQRVQILLGRQPALGRDLLTGREIGPIFEIPPLQPMLVAVGDSS